jgi:uncharacterized membrane protein YagU involved in acid resistance
MGNVEIRVSVGIIGGIVGENVAVGSGVLFPPHADNRKHRHTKIPACNAIIEKDTDIAFLPFSVSI